MASLNAETLMDVVVHVDVVDLKVCITGEVDHKDHISTRGGL